MKIGKNTHVYLKSTVKARLRAERPQPNAQGSGPPPRQDASSTAAMHPGIRGKLLGVVWGDKIPEPAPPDPALGAESGTLEWNTWREGPFPRATLPEPADQIPASATI